MKRGYTCRLAVYLRLRRRKFQVSFGKRAAFTESRTPSSGTRWPNESSVRAEVVCSKLRDVFITYIRRIEKTGVPIREAWNEVSG